MAARHAGNRSFSSQDDTEHTTSTEMPSTRQHSTANGSSLPLSRRISSRQVQPTEQNHSLHHDQNSAVGLSSRDQRHHHHAPVPDNNSNSTPTTNSISTAAPAPAPPPATSLPLSRGRRRKLPVMTSSERAKYYRRKHAEDRKQLEEVTLRLRQQVLHLEVRLQIHRGLLRIMMPPGGQQRILQYLRTFVEDQLHTKSHGLQQQHHELQSVELLGDAQAPVIRVQALVRGRLTTPVIHAIYPFVLGDTVVLDQLMHQQIAYNCTYHFLFTCDGDVQSHSVELDTIVGLRRPLGDLAKVARVVSSGENLHPEAPPPPAAATTSKKHTSRTTKSTDRRKQRPL